MFNLSYSMVSGVSWEFQALTNLLDRVGPLEEPCSGASSWFGDSEGWKGRMSGGSLLWEAQSVVFYEV